MAALVDFEESNERIAHATVVKSNVASRFSTVSVYIVLPFRNIREIRHSRLSYTVCRLFYWEKKAQYRTDVTQVENAASRANGNKERVASANVRNVRVFRGRIQTNLHCR